MMRLSRICCIKKSSERWGGRRWSVRCFFLNHIFTESACRTVLYLRETLHPPPLWDLVSSSPSSGEMITKSDFEPLGDNDLVNIHTPLIVAVGPCWLVVDPGTVSNFGRATPSRNSISVVARLELRFAAIPPNFPRVSRHSHYWRAPPCLLRYSGYNPRAMGK